MSCEECKEQVFELIEREAVDPEGVRAILADCPDCRAEFDAMKAALALAEQLPVEEPPADIDAAILGMAERPPIRRRLLETPPWAMAAIALLAVGVGVWSIPKTVQLESDAVAPEPDPEMAKQKAEVPADQGLAVGSALEEGAVAAMDDDLKGAPAVGIEPATRAGRPERRRATRPKKRRDAFAKESAPEADAENLAMARTEATAEDEDAVPAPAAARRAIEPEATATASDAAAGAAVAEKWVVAEAKSDEGARERVACETKLAAFEKRLSEDRRYAGSPEEQLAMGRCYQILGDTDRARNWLERAAEHSETKRRAKEALRSLPSK